MGGVEPNLRFPDFLGKNEKIQLGSARRFWQNLRIEKILGEIENFFARGGSVLCAGRLASRNSLRNR